MKLSIDQINEFEAYLRQEMSEEIRLDFERRLAAEPALRAAFERHLQVVEGLKGAPRRAEYRDAVKAIRQQMLAEQGEPGTVAAAGKSTFHFSPKVLVAGLLLVGLLAGWIGYKLGKGQAPAQPRQETPTQPSQPQAQSEEEQEEPLVGAGAKGFRFHAPLIRLIPAADSMQVVLVESNRQKTVLERKVLAIHYLPGQMPEVKNIRLVELTLEGKQVLFLKMGGKVYRVREGEQELVEKKDEEVLRWIDAQ